jgi:hypothetical protein
MLSVGTTAQSDKLHFPLGIDPDRVGPKAKTYHARSVRDVAACELNLNGHQLVFVFACFLGPGNFSCGQRRRDSASRHARQARADFRSGLIKLHFRAAGKEDLRS